MKDFKVCMDFKNAHSNNFLLQARSRFLFFLSSSRHRFFKVKNGGLLTLVMGTMFPIFLSKTRSLTFQSECERAWQGAFCFVLFYCATAEGAVVASVSDSPPGHTAPHVCLLRASVACWRTMGFAWRKSCLI